MKQKKVTNKGRGRKGKPKPEKLYLYPGDDGSYETDEEDPYQKKRKIGVSDLCS